MILSLLNEVEAVGVDRIDPNMNAVPELPPVNP